jgi:predicted phosphodiesterase
MHQFPFVDLIKKSELPWYVLLGNHDNPAIFKTIAQATDNFKVYATNPAKIEAGTAVETEQPVELGNLVFWFAHVRYQGPEQEKMDAILSMAQAVSRFPGANRKHVLLLHTEFLRRAESLGFSKENIEKMAKDFDLVISGHEHEFRQLTKSKRVVCAPAAFPTGVKKNSNPARTYTVDGSSLVVKDDWDEPFGYILLDDEDGKVEFVPCHPSAGTIEVYYDISGREEDQVRGDWTEIMSQVKTDAIDSGHFELVVVMPIISGSMERLTQLTLRNDLRAMSDNEAKVFVVEPRFENIVAADYSLESETALPDMTWEAVVLKAKQQVQVIVDRLAALDPPVVLDETAIGQVIDIMVDPSIDFFSSKASRAPTKKDAVTNMVQKLVDFLNQEYELNMDSAAVINTIQNAF